MKILIIRHGDPDYEHDSLTEKGEREAALLAERIAGIEVTDFYLSPLGRARRTYEFTRALTGREAETLPWLQEFRGKIVEPSGARTRICWNFAPQYWTRCPEMFTPDWLSSPIFQTGDTRAIYDETTRGVDELLARYGYTPLAPLLYAAPDRAPEPVIALYCHCAVGQAIVAYLTGMPLPLVWHALFMPTSSVTVLRTEERVPGQTYFRCVQMGDTSHLLKGGEPVSDSGLFSERLTQS